MQLYSVRDAVAAALAGTLARLAELGFTRVEPYDIADPPGLRDGHYPGAKKLGNATGYVYPHAHPDGVVPQQYPPDALVGKDYYRPTNRGVEARLGERLAKLRAIIRRQR